MKTAFITLILIISYTNYAQTRITGQVTGDRHKPLTGVSISIKDSYDGATTDSTGHFQFSTSEKGAATLTATFVGYKNYEQPVTLAAGQLLEVDITMKEEINELNAVVITAGTFEASDEKKNTFLKPLDIATTASANADIAAALKTLPGTQQVGESGELFVRGGDGTETKQFIDGTLVTNPFFSGAPNIATRGRYSPFLFKGTVFSTGGYSALYGQALSSALILESIDLPDQSAASASISPLFLGGQFQQLAKNKRSSWGANYNYTNVTLYFGVVKQGPDYFRMPQFHTGDINFRVKTSQTGMLKFFASGGYSRLGLRNKDIDSVNLKNAFFLTNANLYGNITYREKMANRWKLNAGLAFSYNRDTILQQLQNASNLPVNNYPTYFSNKNFGLNSQSYFAEARAVLEHKFTGLNALRFGAENWYTHDVSQYNGYRLVLDDNLTSVFAEGDIYLTKNIAAKAGARLEHSTLLDKTNIAPRLSLAYKLNRQTQASLAYGIFYQKPERAYLFANADLNYLKATHYIASYQRVDVLHTFRLEAYYKKYEHLVRSTPDTSNGGSGFANGFEVFWRDKKLLKNVDYWISYSYLDTKRSYLNFPYSMTPNFAARHTANLVVKRFFQKLNTQFNANYQFATGRPYYDIAYSSSSNKFTVRDAGRTNSYNNLSMSANYLTNLGKAYTVVLLSVTNILGSNQVFGYNYSYNGLNKSAITPPAKRMIVIGAFLSWGIDRRDDAVNSNL
jgi:vitamin B12 transporter